jgi:hypothetical protein
MGIYIKGMKKKPKDCKACFLGLYDRQAYCHNGEQSLCPLVEVKEPHGRLIDECDINERIRKKLGIRNLDYLLEAEKPIAMSIKESPTVIEAEEGE